MAVLLLDNFDSFTYNLYDCLSSLGFDIDVVRNDVLDFDRLDLYSHIVLSPGPGLPLEAGCMMRLIATQVGKKPILGVCLGMQALALHFGDALYNLELVCHGMEHRCFKTQESMLLRSVADEFVVGLYHSWAITGKSDSFVVTSKSAQGVIMSIENVEQQFYGVQFHPESIMTPSGKTIINNFLSA